MHWNDCFCPASNCGLDFRRIQVVGARIYIDKYRKSPGARYGSRCGEESKRGSNNFIARADIESHKTGEQRICPARDAHGEFAIANSGYLLLKLGNLWPANADLRIEYLCNGSENIVLNSGILYLQIKKWDFHRSSP